jgi:hypothetical protein
MIKEFHVTGVDVYGKRFKIVSKHFQHAKGINLYRGSVWLVNTDGRRKLLWRVWN